MQQWEAGCVQPREIASFPSLMTDSVRKDSVVPVGLRREVPVDHVDVDRCRRSRTQYKTTWRQAEGQYGGKRLTMKSIIRCVSFARETFSSRIPQADSS